jgi:hypothetical protein
MEPDRLEFFRNLLQERLEEILGEADKTREDMTGLAAPFPDPTDRASLETDRNQRKTSHRPAGNHHVHQLQIPAGSPGAVPGTVDEGAVSSKMGHRFNDKLPARYSLPSGSQ